MIIPNTPDFDDWDPGFTVTIPIREHFLSTESIGQLEELSINYAALYQISATSKSSEPGTLPSLVRLTLELADDYNKLSHWLKVVPNVEEVNLIFYTDYLNEFHGPSQEVPIMRLPSLQTIRVTSAFYQHRVSTSTSRQLQKLVPSRCASSLVER